MSVLAFAADRANDADLGLIFLILAIACFCGAVYLALVVNNYVGAFVALIIGIVLLVLG